jgi:hypothetical protein
MTPRSMPYCKPVMGQSGQNWLRDDSLGHHVSVLTKNGHSRASTSFPRKARASEESEHAIKPSTAVRDSTSASQSEPER